LLNKNTIAHGRQTGTVQSQAELRRIDIRVSVAGIYSLVRRDWWDGWFQTRKHPRRI